MYEVSFYTPEGCYNFPLSPQSTSWTKARREARFVLYECDGASDPSHVKSVTIWLYKNGKLSECHTWFLDYGGR